MSQSLAASSAQIDVLVVIDTEYIKNNFPKNTDPKKAQGINHNSQYMICYSPRGIVSGQGTADLSFKANVGDNVSFRGTSIQQNSDDSVILYGIEYWKGDKVFNTFTTNIVTRNRAVQPNPEQQNGIPPVLTTQNFTSYDSKIARGGTENFYVYIAVYTLASDGQTQELYGYYYWDPQVVVPT
ncbi:DNA-directed RNA polymerase subunit beta [Flavobacterium sp. 316]|uniref:Inclusion body family protein n=1 Tax=Flavobacterium sediminilitoris TaxID=2024526 RepID=A0ABY4HNS9_9FLAO|nr:MULTISPECIES: inclusion body family protein [Flavobacterium]KIX21499.1 DNA-directed RNA polymerase subunit beta [Flavobacterium sp. 316]UOX34235.1 inclusion body family protein [Flavobacterium sediminilitoris]